MSFVQGFSSVAAPAAELIAQYDKLYAPARSGKLDEDGRKLFGDLGRQLGEALTLEPISPTEEDADLQQQLIDKDLVHKFGVQSIDELKGYRLGGLSSNKTAFALVNPQAEEGRKILAAIYTYWQHDVSSPITDYKDLAGNVSHILQSPVIPQRETAERAAIFYSISTFNVMAGAGQMLIDRLHARLTNSLDKDVVLSTLSPLRGFSEWLNEQGVRRDNFDETQLKQIAKIFLLANKDGVQRFHMGNGAIIGDINLRANEVGSPDDTLGCNVMVNYVYARSADVIAQNRLNYARACSLGKTDQSAAAQLIFEAMAPAVQAGLETLTEPARIVIPFADQQPRLQA